MINVLLDNNIIIDNLLGPRSNFFPVSKKVYEVLFDNEIYQGYISSSYLDNIEYVLFSELKKCYLRSKANIRKYFSNHKGSLYINARQPPRAIISYE